MEPATGLTTSETTSKPADSKESSSSSNSELRIYCIFSANPNEIQPNSTRWFKDGIQLSNVIHLATPTQAASIRHQNGVTETHIDSKPESADDPHLSESITATGYPVLTIREPTRRDAGLYDCQVSNSIGSSERIPASESCRVEINFKPSVRLRIFRPNSSASKSATSSAGFPMDQLSEVDLSQEIVTPGSIYVLLCDVLEAQPRKIKKYQWWQSSSSSSSTSISSSSRRSTDKPKAWESRQQTAVKQAEPQKEEPQFSLGSSESGQLVLAPLAANFTPTSYSCSAFNSLGSSEPSERIQLELSYTPGEFCSIHCVIRRNFSLPSS